MQRITKGELNDQAGDAWVSTWGIPSQMDFCSWWKLEVADFCAPLGFGGPQFGIPRMGNFGHEIACWT